MSYHLRSYGSLPSVSNLEEVERNARVQRRANVDENANTSKNLNSGDEMNDSNANGNDMVSKVIDSLKPVIETMFQQFRDKCKNNDENRKVVGVSQSRPQTFDHKIMSAKSWMSDFENISKMNCWSDDEKISYLPLSLIGEARRWYEIHSAISDWKVLKSKFLERFDLSNKSIVMEKLRTVRKFENESVLHYYERVLELLNDYDGFFDDEAKREFVVAGLPFEIKTNVIRKKIKFDGLEEFFIEMQTFDLFNKPPTQKKNVDYKKIFDVECYKCGKKGHIKSQCKVQLPGNEKGNPSRQALPK